MKRQDKELIIATQKEDIKAVCALVRKKGADVNVLNEYGDTLLHMAIFQGNRNLFETLILLGADVNKENAKGVLPLHQTISLNRLKMMRRLLQEDRLDVKKTDRYGFSALHLAAFSGLNKEDVHLLVLSGFDVNQKNIWGDTPLFLASTPQMVQALLSVGADTHLKNRWGLTAEKYFGTKRAHIKFGDVKKAAYTQMIFDVLNEKRPFQTRHLSNFDTQSIGSWKNRGFLKYKKMIWQNNTYAR